MLAKKNRADLTVGSDHSGHTRHTLVPEAIGELSRGIFLEKDTCTLSFEVAGYPLETMEEVASWNLAVLGSHFPFLLLACKKVVLRPLVPTEARESWMQQ